jgi:ribosomal protein L21E
MQLPTHVLDSNKRQTQIHSGNEQRLTMSHYVIDLDKRLQWMHQSLAKASLTSQKQPVNKVQESVKPFEVGTTVMAKVLPVMKGLYLPKYEGPYCIKRKIGEWTYELEHTGTRKIIIRNHHHLKKTETDPVHVTNWQAQEKTFRNNRPSRTRLPVQRYGFPS